MTARVVTDRDAPRISIAAGVPNCFRWFSVHTVILYDAVTRCLLSKTQATFDVRHYSQLLRRPHHGKIGGWLVEGDGGC